MFPLKPRESEVDVSGTFETTVSAMSVCARDVVQLTLRRPEGYEFAPGQWLRLTLETAEGTQTKTFSHASAPQDEEIALATRLSGSAFKLALEKLRPLDRVTIAGPGGRLRLPDGASRVAFLTGGVGVTPVRSLLRDAVARRVAFEDALVLYGNRDAECAPYLDELDELTRWGIRVVPVYQDAPTGWSGETGFITADTVRRHVDVSDGRAFVVTGPPPMVGAMDAVLDELGVEVGRRLVERFSG